MLTIHSTAYLPVVAVNSVLLSAYLSAVAVNSVCRVSMVTLVCFSSSLLFVALVYMYTCTYIYIRKYSSTGVLISYHRKSSAVLLCLGL